MNKNQFGLHLMLDLYDCSPDKLNDKDKVREILDVLPEKLGMRKMMDPVVMFAEPNGKKDPGGYSGFVMIQESHISIHTFIGRRFVTIDAYSCKDFDSDMAIKYFEEQFEPKEIEQHLIDRGVNYPTEDIDKPHQHSQASII